MPNSYYWIGGAGSQGWNVGANWLKDDGTTGNVPGSLVAGDSAYVQQGTSDINTSLAAPANPLAYLEFSKSFSGTVGTTGNTSDSLPMNAAVVIIDCATTRLKLDFGANTHATTVRSTGDSADTDLEAVRIRGGTNTSTLNVIDGSVGVATTRPGITATLASASISGGTLNLGSGTAIAKVNQSGGDLTVGCSVTDATTGLQQTGGTLTTTGTGTIALGLLDGGTATLNNRPAAGTAAFTNLTINPDGSADFSQDPRPLTVGNPIVMQPGATLKAFTPTQISVTGGGNQYVLSQAGFDDVTIDMGRHMKVTVAAGP